MNKISNYVQWPNWQLWVAFVGNLISRFATGDLQKLGSVTYAMAIIIWAYLEVTSGLNWFRKVLGAIVLAWTFYSLFKQF